MAGLWSVALRAALRAFESVGLDALEVCRRCDIDPALLDDADARIPLELTGRIWPEGIRMWGRTGLGLHAGRALKFGSLEALDYAFATAPTVGEGFARIAHYYDVVTGGVTGVRVNHADEDEVRVEWMPLPIDELRDYGVACFVERLRFANIRPLRVELRGQPVAPPDEYRDILGDDVSFGRPASVVVIRAADANRALPPSFPGLRDVIDRHLTRVRAEATRSQDPLLDVRREVVAALTQGETSPSLSLKGIAQRLAIGERTLQRRLAAQQLTFQRVVEETKRAVAMEQLKSDRLSVAEIAFLLGYSEPSAFSRAFHRWTGAWPADYRAQSRRHRRRPIRSTS